MKKFSIPGVVVLTILFTVQTGCNLSGKKIDMNAEYSTAKKLELKGHIYRHEGKTDSAIFYFDKSLALYKELESLTDPAKDSLYGPKICMVNLFRGYLFDTLGKPKMEIDAMTESLKWAKLCKYPYTKLIAEELIGLSYLELALDIGATATQHDSLCRKAAIYMVFCCNDVDSLGLDTTRKARYDFKWTRRIFKELKDTDREEYYKIKFDKSFDASHGLYRIGGYPTNKLTHN